MHTTGSVFILEPPFQVDYASPAASSVKGESSLQFENWDFLANTLLAPYTPLSIFDKLTPLYELHRRQVIHPGYHKNQRCTPLQPVSISPPARGQQSLIDFLYPYILFLMPILLYGISSWKNESRFAPAIQLTHTLKLLELNATLSGSIHTLF